MLCVIPFFNSYKMDFAQWKLFLEGFNRTLDKSKQKLMQLLEN